MRTVLSIWIPLWATAAWATPPNADRVAIDLVAKRYAVPVSRVAKDAKASGLSIYDLPPSYFILRASKGPTEKVWRLRQEGRTWPEIAHQMGLAVSADENELSADRFWTQMLNERFGTDAREVDNLHRMGGTWKNVLSAILEGRCQGTNPMTVLQRYLKRRSWE